MSYIRNYEDEIAYKLHKKICKGLKVSITRHISSLIFNNHDGAVIIPNKFPYKCTEFCRHYVLWINPKHEKFWKISRVNVFINKFLKRRNSELVIPIFRNTPENRSVQDIKHFHIICCRKDVFC